MQEQILLTAYPVSISYGSPVLWMATLMERRRWTWGLTSFNDNQSIAEYKLNNEEEDELKFQSFIQRITTRVLHHVGTSSLSTLLPRAHGYGLSCANLHHPCHISWRQWS